MSDFYTQVVRNTPIDKYVKLFIKTWNEDHILALKLLYNLRDIKGKGEKRISQVLLFIIKVNKPHIYEQIIEDIITKYGCWKDLLVISEITVNYGDDKLNNNFELNLFKTQLNIDKISHKNISLASKWAPSEKTHYNNNNLLFASKLADLMGLTPKEYRKLISNLRSKLKIVEIYLTAKQFENIEFKTIPSKAHVKYKNTLNRDNNFKNQIEKERVELKIRYRKYISDLKNGTIETFFVNDVTISMEEALSKYDITLNSNDNEIIEINDIDRFANSLRDRFAN